MLEEIIEEAEKFIVVHMKHSEKNPPTIFEREDDAFPLC